MNWKFWKIIRLRRWHKIVGCIVLFIVLLLAILPAIAKWYITTHGEDLIGRKIDMSGLHINYFRCSIDIEEFVMYEKNSSEKFISFDELYINFAPWHLFYNEYAFTEVTLANPYISIIYSEDGFNFDDLTESSDTTEIEEPAEPEDTTSDPTKYLIRNLNLIGGYIRFEDRTANSVTEIKKLGITVPEIAWNNSKSELGIDFILGENGEVSLGGNVNQAAGEYKIQAKTKNIDISPFAGYLKDYMTVSSMNGHLYTDITVKGEMAEPMNAIVSGNAGISEFALNDMDGSHFFSAADIYIKMDSLDIGKENYCIDSVLVESPKLTAVLDKSGTNFDRILEPYFSDTLDVAEDSIVTDTSITEMHYSIKSLLINDCMLAFSDLTLNRPFRFDITNLDFKMDDYSDLAAAVKMDFSMILNNTGSFKGNAVIDMVTLNTITFDGVIANLDMVSLSPYSEYFIARPITKGTINYTLKLSMNPTYLNNQNTLKIVNLETGKKTKDTPTYKVPVGLALYILKDRNNIIGFDLLVTGNPSDPSFRLRKIIWKTLEEFLIKTATAPFKAIGNLFGTNPESISQVPFEIMQDSLMVDQKNNLDKIAEIIIKKPELIFTFSQSTNPDEEMNLLAIREAKLQFVRSKSGESVDPITIQKVANEMRDNDSEFRQWLGMTDLMGASQIPSFCMQKIGNVRATELLNELMLKRESLLRNYFAEKGVPAYSIQFKIADLRNLPEELKKPMFTVEITMN